MLTVQGSKRVWVGLAAAGVDADESADVEEVEVGVAVGVTWDEALVEEVEESADVEEVEISGGVVVCGA